jgi:hypothetical protein
MFLKRQRKGPRKEVPAGVPIPRHLGEVWHILQDIAREEDPRFADVSIVEHFNASAEGYRDVVRWLNIYQRRLDPAHRFELPAHHPRHRGHVLIERSWPEGLRWEAFHEQTWLRVPLPGAATREELVRALEAHLDGRGP